MEKWLLLAVAILIVLVIIVLSIRLSRRVPGKHEICFTPGCIETAAKVLQKMDLSVDPCKDFYKFSCGKFINDTVLPQSKTSISSFSIVSDMVDEQLRTLLETPIKETDPRPFVLSKSLYQACMNTTEIEANALPNLKKIFKKIGGWPVVEGQRWDEKRFSWTSTSYEFMKLGVNFRIFFDFIVKPDVANSSRYLLNVNFKYFKFENVDKFIPKLVSFDKLMRQGFNESLVQSYYNYIVKVAVAFGADANRAHSEMRDVINLYVALTRITVPTENRRNSLLENNPMTIRELEQKYPYVPWLEYINVMMHPTKVMTYNDTVVVTLPQYFKDLERIIKNTPNKILANYMYWRAVKILISYLNKELRTLELEFSKIISGNSEPEPRWKECMQTKLGTYIATGALYVKHFFNKESKQTMIELVDNIQHQFIEILKTVDWMDDVTRQHALEKAEAIRAYIAYPDELLNDEKIDEYYRNLTVNPQKYLESAQNVTLFVLQNMFKKLDMPADTKDWKDHALAIFINAYYNPNQNSIEFPASLLQDVFFGNNRPQYMNYAAIGYVVGHEITHGFDDMGRQFDKNGNLVDWWQPKTKEAFNAKAQCIIDQYGNITVPEINLNLNGINTQGENIADNGGIKQAYLAYKKWVNDHAPERSLPGLPYTPEQMFWISAGNTWCEVQRTEELKIDINNDFHSPKIYRINVPLMNSEYFAKDFNCPKGSPMNPVHKCVVW
ncbi:Peptidase M13 N domain containing protein, partial [Asbolus verrucosus]